MSIVPVPNDAERIGPASSSGGSTTQSYLVDGVTPEQLINDYQQLATGAGMAGRVGAGAVGHRLGADADEGRPDPAVTTSPADDDNESDQTELALIVTGSG